MPPLLSPHTNSFYPWLIKIYALYAGFHANSFSCFRLACAIFRPISRLFTPSETKRINQSIVGPWLIPGVNNRRQIIASSAPFPCPVTDRDPDPRPLHPRPRDDHWPRTPREKAHQRHRGRQIGIPRATDRSHHRCFFFKTGLSLASGPFRALRCIISALFNGWKSRQACHFRIW